MKLNIGKKYTILKFTDKGGLDYKQFVLERILSKPSGNEGLSDYTLVTTGDKNIIKWEKFVKIRSGEQFVIWEGYYVPNTSIMVSRGIIDSPGGHTIAEKRWDHKDPRYLIRAKKGIKVDPVEECLNPLRPERLTIYQTISS